MRRFLLITAALVAAVLAYGAVTGPAPRQSFGAALPPTVWAGAYHVHSTQSDGAAAPDAIASAAKRAGLRFVILTDHGDATRVPDAPRYIDGVLLVDAVEISAQEGHVVALGLTGPAPYPLGGEARDVIEDIHRLGGFAIVAHPDSARDGLRWRPVGPDAGRRGGGPALTALDLSGADGLEWLNADSAWREHPWTTLAAAALHTPLRATETMAALYARPDASLRRWEALTRRRPVIGLAAHDAHRFYGAALSSLAQVALLDTAPSGDPARDSLALLAAFRRGRTYSVITGQAGVVMPAFAAADAARTVQLGERLTSPVGPVTIDASTPDAPEAMLALRRDDRVVASGRGRLEFRDAGAGAYRLEASLREGTVPWIVTNPIYVDPPAPTDVSAPAIPPRPAGARPEPDVRPDTLPLPADAGWQVERSPSSTATITASGPGLEFEYVIGRQDRGEDYVALSRPLGSDAAAFDRLEFVVSSTRPARVQIQFRLRGGRDQERWGRSVYVDATPRPVTVRMADLQPIGFNAMRRPIAAHVESVLLVLAWPTTAPGTSGRLSVSAVRLVRGDSGPDGQQQIQRPGQEQQVGGPRGERRR